MTTDLARWYRTCNQCCNEHRVADGLIVEVWVTADNLALLDQLR